MTELCGDTLASRSEPDFDPYEHWLNIPSDLRPINHYVLLGLRMFETSVEKVQEAADQRMEKVRSFQTGRRGVLTQPILNELSRAKLVLIDPSKKADYDRELLASLNETSEVGDGEGESDSGSAVLVAETELRPSIDRPVDSIQIAESATAGSFDRFGVDSKRDSAPSTGSLIRPSSSFKKTTSSKTKMVVTMWTAIIALACGLLAVVWIMQSQTGATDGNGQASGQRSKSDSGLKTTISGSKRKDEIDPMLVEQDSTDASWSLPVKSARLDGGVTKEGGVLTPWDGENPSANWKVNFEQPEKGFFQGEIEYRCDRELQVEISFEGKNPKRVSLYPTDGKYKSEIFVVRIPRSGKLDVQLKPTRSYEGELRIQSLKFKPTKRTP